MRGVLLSLFAIVGCGGEKPADAPAGIAVRGVATFDKRPAAGAVLLFHGSGTGLPPRAVVGADGKFELTMPAGQYAVTVEWRIGSEENGGERKSLAPDRFTRKESTPLKPTVAAGPDGTCDLGTLTIAK